MVIYKWYHLVHSRTKRSCVTSCRSQEKHTSWCLIQMSNSWPFISHNSHFILHTLCPFLSFSFSALTSSLFFWWVLFLFLCLTKFNRFLFFFLLFLLSDLGFLPLAFILQELFLAQLGALLESGSLHRPPLSSACFPLKLFIGLEKHRRYFKTFLW